MKCACGPSWLPQSLVHWYLKIVDDADCFFHRACTLHDKRYEKGEGLQLANDLFLRDMIMDAQKATDSPSDKTPSRLQLKRAISYYRLVTIFGWISYTKWFFIRRKNQK